MKLKVAVAGSTGRLGQAILNVLQERQIAAKEISRESHADKHQLAQDIDGCSAILDVSLAGGSAELCKRISSFSEIPLSLKCMVIGTTGHSAEQMDAMEETSLRIPLILASNFSKGIYLLQELLQARTKSGLSVSELAKSLDFDLGLHESHHVKKIDAPSGTARVLAQTAGIDTEKVTSLRVGRVVGEHTVVISGDAEELRLTHTAQDRRLFAVGAIDLLEKMHHKEIQLRKQIYPIQDVLSLVYGKTSKNKS